MTKLEKNGKGIILMHDFQHATAEAMPELLRQLKAAGYKVVHMVPKQPVTTLPKYDDMVTAAGQVLVSNNTRPEAQRRSHHQTSHCSAIDRDSGPAAAAPRMTLSS